MPPRVGSAVEVYSQTAGSWLPATVLAVDGDDTHVRYTVSDGSTREKWAAGAECREPVVAHARSVATAPHSALPPRRRGTAAPHVVSERFITRPDLGPPPTQPKKSAPAIEPLRVGDSHIQVFSASAGRWVEAAVVEVDDSVGGQYRVSYGVGGEQRQKWVSAADVRTTTPVFGQFKQTQEQAAPARRSSVQPAVGSACQVFSTSAATWVRATLLELDGGDAVRFAPTICPMPNFSQTHLC